MYMVCNCSKGKGHLASISFYVLLVIKHFSLWKLNCWEGVKKIANLNLVNRVEFYS